MDRTTTDLTCPKCGGEMRAQERQGIVIEVCGTCRGVFLDRGELDRLLDLEASRMPPATPYGQDAYAAGGVDPRMPGSDPRMQGYDRRRRGDRDDDDDDDDDFGGRGGRRRGGFLDELFGGFGD